MRLVKRSFFLFLLLFIPLQTLFAAKTDTLLIHSQAMQRNLKAVIVLPQVYFTADDSFPVVYLLHGYSGNYSDWSRKINLGELADRYGFILVCPDGGYNSWYLDSPVQPSSQYETHIIKEVLPYIKSHFRTLVKKRAITGLSMGGQGALYLAARHPGLFCAAASMSGGVDLTFSSKRWEIAEKLGSYKEFPQRWKDNSVVNMIGQLKKAHLHLFIDCGINDMFISVNRKLHQKLIKASVPHDYIERPGGHSWPYWTNALEYHLLFFRKCFSEEMKTKG